MPIKLPFEVALWLWIYPSVCWLIIYYGTELLERSSDQTFTVMFSILRADIVFYEFKFKVLLKFCGIPSLSY